MLTFRAGEEALTIFVDKRKLSKKAEVSDYSSNSSTVTLEALHQLAASYFIDRESTLRKLHHIQIASTAIKVKILDSLCRPLLRCSPKDWCCGFCIFFDSSRSINQVKLTTSGQWIEKCTSLKADSRESLVFFCSNILISPWSLCFITCALRANFHCVCSLIVNALYLIVFFIVIYICISYKCFLWIIFTAFFTVGMVTPAQGHTVPKVSESYKK